MGYDEYAKLVWSWIKPHLDRPDVTPDDIESLEKDIQKMYKAGWTVVEARLILMQREEVRPYLNEDRALAEMKRITDAVAQRLGVNRDTLH